MNRTKLENFLALTRALIMPAVVLLLSTNLYAANQFDINVPKRGAGAGSKAIFQIDSSIYVDDLGPITFRVTDPEGVSHDFNLDPSVPCGGSPNPCAFDFPIVGSGADSLAWTLPPAVGPSGDPALFKYELTINPNSNTDFLSSPGECQDIHPGGIETYAIEVLAGREVTSACLLSYELNAVGDECNNLGTPLEDPLVATVNSGSSGDQLCKLLRPGVDAALVLDKSGSMNGSPMAGSSGTKIEALRTSVDMFVERWIDIRDNETSPPTDQVGVVLFDANASWLGGAAGLGNFAAIAPSVSVDLAAVNAGGATSIGDGLSTASAALAAGSNRKVILLMSDGKENTHQRVRLWDTNGGGSVLAWTDLATIPTDQFESRIRIQLGSNSTGWVDMDNEDLLRIYAVTIGSASAVSAEINQGLALATGGFYINSETNANILPVFFIELLQNFVKFNTWDVVALRAANTGANNAYKLRVPLTSTSKGVSMDLSWNPDFGSLCLDVFEPGITNPKTICSSRNEKPGQLSWSRNFSASTDSIPKSGADWRFVVRAPSNTLQRNIPFFLIAMAEETNLKTDFAIGKDDYVPGSSIPIQVKMTESGRPITSKVKVDALVAGPGQSVGDLLSRSRASAKQPHNGDRLTDADAKLQNELSENGEALQTKLTSINLLDNGDKANGDEFANDGIYTALYQVNAPGHYNILFNSHGKSKRSGRLHKEQLMSIYVRNQPDPDETIISTSITQVSGNSAGVLTVNFTPKTKNGFKMGPGWANYFWFRARRLEPFKARDNLDGSYTATINLPKKSPTSLSLHFLDAAQFIGNSVEPDNLPLRLDKSTSVFPKINLKDKRPKTKPWWHFFRRTPKLRPTNKTSD